MLFEFFSVCSSQVRAGMAGVYGLDWPAIVQAARACGGAVDGAFYAMLRAYESGMLASVNKKNETGD